MGSCESKISPEASNGAKVVIVGGGYGGVALALALRRRGINFVLIDAKEFFHHNYTPLTVIPYAETFGDDFVRGLVVDVKVGEKKVVLEDGETINFTHLVLATGSDGPFPSRGESGRILAVKEEYSRVAEQIEQAQQVVIIGGGTVGFEMAGEIRDKYQDKSITIINSGKRLLSRVNLGEKIQQRATDLVEARGVTLLLGEKVSNLDELTPNVHKSQVVQMGSKTVNADLVLVCTGLRPNVSLFDKVFDDVKSHTDPESGRLLVTPELLVVGCTNIFAIGDCCNTQGEKMAAHAEVQGQCVAENIARSITGNLPLQPYKPKFEGMLATFGRGEGVGVMNGWSVPSFMVRFYKARSLFTSKYWADMGQTMPS